MKLDEKERDEWMEALKRNAEGLASSSIFLQIWSDEITKDPLACMQMGLCVMLDKPIYMMVPYGSKVPENMKKMAVRLQFFDRNVKGDVGRAAKELMEFAMKHGVIAKNESER